MSRLRADLLLLLAAFLWGTTFVAQKMAAADIGPFLFVGSRFLISAVILAPFAYWERLRRRKSVTASVKTLKKHLAALYAVFLAGVAAQQFAMQTTSVTNAGFLTGLYVLLTPFAAWLILRERPSSISWVAAVLCLLGVFLLGDGSLSRLTPGDWLAIFGAAMFAAHTVLITLIVVKSRAPLTLAFQQYTACALFGLLCAALFETVELSLIMTVLPEVLYAAVMSGAIAYTLQIVSQQHTPPSDAAVILSGEALFAALAGAWLMGDRLSWMGWTGCGLILFAILAVQLAPHAKKYLLLAQRGKITLK
jgi:drug/metabolite transporter (DMT)-like permease